MNSLQAISEIITKWKINQTLLADRLGMPKGTFVNNLKGRKYYSFTEDQLAKLKATLIELRADLEAVDDVDFNEALRIISQKEV